MSLFVQPFIEQRSAQSATTLPNPVQWLINFFGGEPTSSGQRINALSAMRVTAVQTCVRIRAETLGSLPLRVHSRRQDGGKDIASNHPNYRLLHTEPNPEMTSPEWLECGEGHNSLRGRHISQIVFGADGRPAELWPLHPDRVRIKRDDRTDALRYHYTDAKGREFDYSPEQVLHIRGLSDDGINAHSPIGLAREAIGLALAAEAHGGKFFSNAATPSGVLEYPNSLEPKQYDRLRTSFAEQTTGNEGTHKPLILEQGLKWTALGMKPVDAQFLESRKFQVTEIARLFRIPPHMIADLDRSTNNNIEHQAMEFLVNTMLPIIRKWEARLNRQLFGLGRDRRFFCEFDVAGLLRGDIKTRFEAYQIAINNGWMNPDEVRQRENTNPIPDGAGEKFRVQQGFTTLDKLGETDLTPLTEKKSAIVVSLRPALEAAATRALRREVKALTPLIKRGLPAADLSQFYTDHCTYLREAVGPIFEGVGAGLERDLTPRVGPLVADFVAEQRRLVEAAPETINDQWASTRAAHLANKTLDTLAA